MRLDELKNFLGEICPISVRAKTSLKKFYNEHLISIGNTVTRISKKCNNE